eukprot:UN18038
MGWKLVPNSKGGHQYPYAYETNFQPHGTTPIQGALGNFCQPNAWKHGKYPLPCPRIELGVLQAQLHLLPNHNTVLKTGIFILQMRDLKR